MKNTTLIVLILLSASLFSYCQKTFTDSTNVIGFVKNGSDGTSLGKSTMKYCMLSLDKKVENGTLLIVTGIKHCIDESILKKEAYFYEVSYKGEQYFIDKNCLFFIDSVDYMTSINNLSAEQYQKFHNRSVSLSEIYHEDKVSKIYKKLNSNKSIGLSIVNWNIFDVSEYTDGTGVSIEIYNPTSKTIKYISFSFVGKNPVGDVVYKNKQASVKVRGVGPVEPQESASYSFDYAWFTDLVQTARISHITVTYMDGTIKEIDKPKSIELPYEDYNYIKEDE